MKNHSIIEVHAEKTRNVIYHKKFDVMDIISSINTASEILKDLMRKKNRKHLVAYILHPYQDETIIIRVTRVENPFGMQMSLTTKITTELKKILGYE